MSFIELPPRSLENSEETLRRVEIVDLAYMRGMRDALQTLLDSIEDKSKTPLRPEDMAKVVYNLIGEVEMYLHEDEQGRFPLSLISEEANKQFKELEERSKPEDKKSPVKKETKKGGK